jgi:hypothetical protein
MKARVAEIQMARLAKFDIEIFKEKQTEIVQKFDPKVLKQ